MNRFRVLVTGASGFIGRALLERLVLEPDVEVIGAVRRPMDDMPKAAASVHVGSLEGGADWREALNGVDTVIHAAARVHVMNETVADPLAEFRKVNVEGTLNLARQAACSGVRRFVFVSSIKVNGEGTKPGQPYTADAQPMPVEPYGISKLEAERGLRQLAADSGMDVVIVRPVLVYGPGVQANFRIMMDWLSRRVPLPLGAIRNKRSLVALENLVDLIAVCIHHPAAANQTFLVSDHEDLSTTELLQRMALALGKPAFLVPVPVSVLEWGARMMGRVEVARRLCGSLQVDISKTRELLNWSPPLSVDEALSRTARHFLEHRRL